MTQFRYFAGAAVLVLLPQVALAERSPEAVCQRMVDTDQSGDITMEQCLCTYNVADSVLDDDIKALLFEAWYTGENVTEQLNQLPNPKRVKRQFGKMDREMNFNC